MWELKLGSKGLGEGQVIEGPVSQQDLILQAVRISVRFLNGMPKPRGRKVSVAAARAGSIRPVWRCMCVPAPKQGVPYSGMHCYLSWSSEKSFRGWILEPTAST